MSLNNKFEDLTIHDADTDIGASPPKETRVTPAQQNDVLLQARRMRGQRRFRYSSGGLIEIADSTVSASEKETARDMHTVYFWPYMESRMGRKRY